MNRGSATSSSARSVRAALVASLLIAASVVGVAAAPVVLAAGAQPLSTGLDADGQLGNGVASSRRTPGSVSVPATMVAIAAGRQHAYALDDTGRIWAWGDNSRGAVGDGTNTDRQTPVRLALTNVVQVEAGHYHGIALRADGTVWTWGFGNLGQLGLGTTGNRNSPVQVPGLSGIAAVAAGRDMSYAVRSNGTMMAWGNNSFGEVGDGTTTRRTSPVAVVGLTNVVEVAGGRDHALVVRSNGSMWAWGANERGQVGNGSTANRLTPVEVLGGSVAHVDAGAEHSLAVMTNGTVRAWGRGQRGQLGLGTTSNQTTPTVVPGLSGIVEVGDGRDHSFAMNAAGAVWAWGNNDEGQLGDGTTTRRLSPVRINALSGIVAAQGGRAMTIFLPGASADPDVTPPSVPGKPNVTSTVAGRADVTWEASTDDRATSLTYSVYRDGGGTPIGTVLGGTSGIISYADNGLAGGSVHTYRVRASDGVNQSGLSPTSDPVTIAEGGGGGALLGDDFSGGLAGWSTTGAFNLDPSTGSTAAPSARVAVAGSRAQGRRSLSTPATNVSAAVDVRVASISGSAKYTLMKLRTSGGSSVAHVEVSSSQGLFVRADVAGPRFNVGRTLSFGSWHRLTLCVDVGPSGSLTLGLDGTEIGSWNANTGSQPVATLQLGDTAVRTATVNWDDVLVTEQP